MNDDLAVSARKFMDEQDQKKMSRHGWVGFVESDAVNFMTQYDIEKMTLDDGAGNRAKLTRIKENGIKVECTSSNIL